MTATVVIMQGRLTVAEVEAYQYESAPTRTVGANGLGPILTWEISDMRRAHHQADRLNAGLIGARAVDTPEALAATIAEWTGFQGLP